MNNNDSLFSLFYDTNMIVRNITNDYNTDVPLKMLYVE